MNVRTRLRPYAAPFVIFAIAWWALLIRDTGLNENAVYPILNNLPLLGLGALAIGVTVIGGELDLSIGSMAAVAGMVAVQMQSLGIVLAIAAGCLVGMIFGALQGYSISRLGVSSVVFTVGTLIFLRGVAYIISEQALLVDDLAMGDVLARRVGPLSVSSLVAVATFVIIGVFMSTARVGREIYAVGGSKREARSAGVDLRRSAVVCFAISGGCASLAGSLAAFEGGSASPGSFQTMLLLAVTAVLVGGVSFGGGGGSVLNIALGVAALASVSAGMANLGQPSYVAQLVTGCLLIAVIASDGIRSWWASRSSVRHALPLKSPA